jgi:hypothetical protein
MSWWRTGLVMIAAVALLSRAPAAAQCVGDCSGDGMVNINDLWDVDLVHDIR